MTIKSSQKKSVTTFEEDLNATKRDIESDLASFTRKGVKRWRLPDLEPYYETLSKIRFPNT